MFLIRIWNGNGITFTTAFILLLFNVIFSGGEEAITDTESPLTILPTTISEQISNNNFNRNSPYANNASTTTTESYTFYGEIPLPKNYSKFHIPLGELTYQNGKPWRERVNVLVSIFLRRFLAIDEQTEEILIDSDIGLQWTDWNIAKHLILTNFSTAPLQKDIKLDSEFLNAIWKPDVYIDEMSAAGNASLLSKLITLKFLLGDPLNPDSGDIVYSSRNTLRLRCPMDFSYYPADTQTCIYHIRSYSYHDNELKLRWSDAAIYLNDPGHANFNLQVSNATPNPYEANNHFHVLEKFSKYRVGRYSALQFTIKMRRKLSYHVVLTYLPSILLILITWLCFLLPSNMVEARIGISMTTVLTLTAMFTAVREQSPTVSYTMAIDIWMVFHIFFVFLALALFTISYWMKVKVKRQDKILQKKSTLKDMENCGEHNKTSETISEAETRAMKHRKEFHWIVTFTKRYAFWAFALVYLIFLVGYWSWLLISSGHLNWEVSSSLNRVSVLNGNGNDSDNLYVYSNQRTPGEEDFDYITAVLMDNETTVHSNN